MNKLKKLITTFLLTALISTSSAQDGKESFEFTLQDAQKYAIENSYMSINAKKEVLKSEKKVDETIGTGLPQISATGNYQQYIQTPLSLVPANTFQIPGQAVDPNQPEFIELFFGTEQQMGVGIRAEQLLFDGTFFVGLQASKVYLEITKNDLKRSNIEVKQMVTVAYGNVLVAKRNSEILKGNIDILEKSVFETNELYETGFIEEQDKDQIQLTLANVKNSYENATRMIEISKNQLKYIMGIDVESSIVLIDDLPTITTQSTSETYLSTDFDPSTHIDYQIINTQQLATNLLLKQQRATNLPRVSAFYSFSSNAFSNEFDFFDQKRFYNGQSVGLNINAPIFSGFSRYNRIQQAKIDVDKIETSKKQVSQQLILEAQNKKSQYTFAISQYQTTEDNMKLAQRIFDRTKIKYNEGISSSLDLTTANNQLLDSQSKFISAAFQLIQAKANLDKALNQ